MEGKFPAALVLNIFLRDNGQNVVYNVMSAKEKQAAAKQTFVFHALISEQTDCGAVRERGSAGLRAIPNARQRGFASDSRRAAARVCERFQTRGSAGLRAIPDARQRGFASDSRRAAARVCEQ